MFPTNSFFQKVQSGTAWTADTTIQALTLFQYLRFKAANPVGSGVIVQIYAFGGWAGAATNLVAYKNPSTAVTTNVVTPMNQNFASNLSSSLAVTWDTSTTNLTGTYYRTLPVNTNWQEYNGEIIFLYPGQSIGFSAIPGVATNAIAHLSWTEQTLTQS